MTEQTAPARVPVERIDDLMASLKIHCLRYPGTTTTVAIAVLPGVGDLPGFTVAEGLAFCNDPLDFDARIGVTKATKNVKEKARATLWMLEAYTAWRQHQDEAIDAGMRYSVAPARPPHQQKVVDEKMDLDARIVEMEAEMATIGLPGSIFDALPRDEQLRLHNQIEFMRGYSRILADRIAAF